MECYDAFVFLFYFYDLDASTYLEWKRFVQQKTMVPCWGDVRSGASGYGCYWFYVEMARSVNVIILRRNGETIFDYLFHVFPVRMGTKSYRCTARHDLFRDYRGGTENAMLNIMKQYRL